jgi:GDP-L-fucose synthase
MISTNVLEAARVHGVKKVIVLGSSCIYPRDAPQPISEQALLTGPLEPTNEGYAIAKIAALELGKMYRRQYGMDVVSLMPSNVYGPGDNFDPVNSHVLAALIRRCHEAKLSGNPTMEVWGTGTPRREFLYVDDLADAALFVLVHYEGEDHLNVGTGTDVTIRELADLVAQTVGWRGELVFNEELPDGVACKLLDVSRLSAMGWSAKVGLTEGLLLMYEAYVRHATAAHGP